MVDVTAMRREGYEGESSKIKSFMGKTPEILKSKFLSVLGNSNEILNGISNKLDITLSLSTSSSDEDCDDDEEENQNCNEDDESVDMSTIDFESRRVKERRAHEEIISGRFRHPVPKVARNGLKLNLPKKESLDSDSSSKSSSYSNSIDSKSPNKGDSDLEEELKDLSNNGLTRTPPEISISPPVQQLSLLQKDNLNDSLSPINNCIGVDDENAKKKPSNSSTLTSLNDHAIPSMTTISLDDLIVIRSESENSVPSWASSISLDNRDDNIIKEFMKKFIDILFTNSSAIGLEFKSEFGQYARTEIGRLWFSRYVSAQRSKSKRVDETTFYSLVQYFAIILFECAESDDYSPAKTLMNMCFTFYNEIEVPGCEPYREYLFTYLREQPIWHSLRFWNAAFFDAIQCERAHRPTSKSRKNKQSVEQKQNAKDSNNISIEAQCKNDDQNESDSSPGSSALQQDTNCEANNEEMNEDEKIAQNIAFGQLGTFTCNMHAFGLSKDLCLEFLHKQSTIANLPKDQEKLLRDNINRMYLETEKWGA